MGVPFTFFKKNSTFATGALKVDAVFATDNSPAMQAFQGWLADNTVVTSLNDALISENIGLVDTDSTNITLSNRFSYTRMDSGQTLANQYYIEVIFNDWINPSLGAITQGTRIIFRSNNVPYGDFGFPSFGKSYEVVGVTKKDDLQIIDANYDALSGKITIVTDIEHGYSVGDAVKIRGIIPTTYNSGTGIAEITDISDTTFSYVSASNPGTYLNGGFVYKLSKSLLLTEFLIGRATSTFTNGSTAINLTSVLGEVSVGQTVTGTGIAAGTTVNSYNSGTGVLQLSAPTNANATNTTLNFKKAQINSQIVPVGAVCLASDNPGTGTTLAPFYSLNAGEVANSRIITNSDPYYVFGDRSLRYFWSTYVDPSFTTTASGLSVYSGWYQNATSDGSNTLFADGYPSGGITSQMVIGATQVTANEDTFNNIIKSFDTNRLINNISVPGYNPRSKAALLFISASNEQGSVSATRDTSRGSETPGYTVRNVVEKIKDQNGYWIGIIGGDLNQQNQIEVFKEDSEDGIQGDPRGFIPIKGAVGSIRPGAMIENITSNGSIVTVTTFHNHNFSDSSGNIIPIGSTARVRIKNSIYAILNGIRNVTITSARQFTFEFNNILPPVTSNIDTRSDWYGYVLCLSMLANVPNTFYRKSTLQYTLPTGDTRTANNQNRIRKDILTTIRVFDSQGLLTFFNSNVLGDFYIGLPGDSVTGTDYVAYNIDSSNDIKFNIKVYNSAGSQFIQSSLLDPGTTLVSIKQSFIVSLYINEISAVASGAIGSTTLTVSNITDLNPLTDADPPGNLGREGVTTIQTDHILDGLGILPKTRVIDITDLGGGTFEIEIDKPLTQTITSQTVFFSFPNTLKNILIYVNTKNNFKDMSGEVSFPGYGFYSTGLLDDLEYGDVLTSSEITNPIINIDNVFWTFSTTITPNGISWVGTSIVSAQEQQYNLLLDADSPGIGVNARFRITRTTTQSYRVDLLEYGSNFSEGEIITVLGSQLGGVDGVNDLVITVTSIDNLSYVTLTTQTQHNFVPPSGRTEVRVSIKGNTPSAYNGTYEATVLDNFTLKYDLENNPGTLITPGTVRNVSIDVINDTFAFLNDKLFFNVDNAYDPVYPYLRNIVSGTDLGNGNIQVVTDEPHNFLTGQEVAIGGILSTTGNWNTTKTNIVVVDATTFNYPSPGGQLGTYVAEGYVTNPYMIVFGGVYTKNFDRIIFLNTSSETLDGVPPQKSQDYLVRKINFRQVSNDGDIVVDGPKHDFFLTSTSTLAISDRTVNISSMVWSERVVTVTTTEPHRFFEGNEIDINGADPTAYNSPASGDIILTVPSSTTFTYARLLNPGPYVSGASVTKNVRGAGDVFLGPSGGQTNPSRDIIKLSNITGIPGVDPLQDYYIRQFSGGTGGTTYASFQIGLTKIGPAITFSLTIESSSFDTFTGKGAITTAEPHYLETGNIVTITGVNSSLYNGTYTVEVISPFSFVYLVDLPEFTSASPNVVNTTQFSTTISSTNAVITKRARGPGSIGSNIIPIRTSGTNSSLSNVVPGQLVIDLVTPIQIQTGTTVLSIDTANTQITISQNIINSAFTTTNNTSNDITLNSNVAGARTIAVTSVTNLAVGQLVTGTNIPANTFIVSISGNIIQLSNALTGTASGTVTFNDNVAGSKTIVYSTFTGTQAVGSLVIGTGIDPNTTIDSITGTRIVLSSQLSANTSGTYTLQPTPTSTNGSVTGKTATITAGVIQNQTTDYNGQVQLTPDVIGWDHPQLARSTAGALFFQLGFVKNMTGNYGTGTTTTISYNGSDNSGISVGLEVYGYGIAPGSRVVTSGASTITLDRPLVNSVSGLVGFARPGQVSIFPKYTQEFGRILGKTFAEWLFKIA